MLASSTALCILINIMKTCKDMNTPSVIVTGSVRVLQCRSMATLQNQPLPHSQASGEHHNAFQWDLAAAVAAATTVWHLMLDAWCGYSLRLMPLDDHLGQLPVQADTLFWGLKPSKFFLICQGEEKFVPPFSNDVVQTTSWRVIFWSHFEHFDT